MSNGVFKDLEINFDDMMTDPEGFSKRIYEAAESLRATCKADTSIAALTRQFEESAVDPDQVFYVLNDAFYKYADEFPIEMMPRLIKMAKQHVSDLEDAFKDRVIREASSNSDSMADKRLAALYYSDLRKAFNSYADFMRAFKKVDIKDLPVLPGNYGSQTGTLKYYTYEFKDETFRNPRMLVREVCTVMGVDLPEKQPSTYMDVVDFLNAHPDLKPHVQIKELH